jgi:AraC-like DNA-binding protein
MSDAKWKIQYDPNALQRMSFVTGIPDVLRDFGVTLEQAIAGLPIDPQAFSDLDRRIPYSLISELFLRCAGITDCPHFGLLLGSRHDHRCLGFPGLLMKHAPTLEAALSAFVRMQPTNSRGASTYLHRNDEESVILGYGIYDRSAVGHAVVYAAVMAVAFNAVLALTRGVARPAEVLVSFRRPADIKPYSKFFGVPVRFDQPQTGLVLPLSALAAPIPGARAAEFERLKAQAAAADPPSDRVWTDRVRHSIRPMLLRGNVTTETAAARLGLGLRALSRRLEAEETTFQWILGDIRYVMARELLTVTDMPIGAIADALSYSAHASFVDAFRRWSGTTPSEWRRAIHAQ